MSTLWGLCADDEAGMSEKKSEQIAAMRAEVKRRLADPKRQPVTPTPPRYDDAFFEFLEWLEKHG